MYWQFGNGLKRLDQLLQRERKGTYLAHAEMQVQSCKPASLSWFSKLFNWICLPKGMITLSTSPCQYSVSCFGSCFGWLTGQSSPVFNFDVLICMANRSSVALMDVVFKNVEVILAFCFHLLLCSCTLPTNYTLQHHPHGVIIIFVIISIIFSMFHFVKLDWSQIWPYLDWF